MVGVESGRLFGEAAGSVSDGRQLKLDDGGSSRQAKARVNGQCSTQLQWLRAQDPC